MQKGHISLGTKCKGRWRLNFSVLTAIWLNSEHIGNLELQTPLLAQLA